MRAPVPLRGIEAVRQTGRSRLAELNSLMRIGLPARHVMQIISVYPIAVCCTVPAARHDANAPGAGGNDLIVVYSIVLAAQRDGCSW